MSSRVDFSAVAEEMAATELPGDFPLFVHCRASVTLERNGWKRKIAGEVDFGRAVAAYAECTRYKKKGIYVFGESGCGKTAFVRAMLKHPKRDTHFLSLEKDWERLNAEDWPYFIMELMKCNVVLDDVGVEPSLNHFGSRREVVTDFVLRYYRLGTGRLFITTNLTGEVFTDRYTPRVSSRIKELCIPLVFTGKDKRAWILPEIPGDTRHASGNNTQSPAP